MPRLRKVQLGILERSVSKIVVVFFQNPSLFKILNKGMSHLHSLHTKIKGACHIESCHNLVHLAEGIPWYHLSYLYKRIGFFSVLNLCVRLSVRPSDILLARTQGNGYHSVSGVSLSVMGITQCPVCL